MTTTSQPSMDACHWQGAATYHRVGHLFVVTDVHGRVIAVAVFDRTNKTFVMSDVRDPPPSTTLNAEWTGAMPSAGDYLQSSMSERCAYMIVEDPCTDHLSEVRDLRVPVRIVLAVAKVQLPLPSAAKVYVCTWGDRGLSRKNVSVTA